MNLMALLLAVLAVCNCKVPPDNRIRQALKARATPASLVATPTTTAEMVSWPVPQNPDSRGTAPIDDRETRLWRLQAKVLVHKVAADDCDVHMELDGGVIVETPQR